MVTDPNIAVRARPWWERAVDTVVDALEENILDPVDAVVTSKLERHQAATAHRLASRARLYAEIYAVRCWSFYHRTRARRLAAWAAAESAVAHTRAGLHAGHAGGVDDSGGCCAPLIRLYRDRAELLQALAVTEEQTAPLPGRSPNFGAMPGRMRRIAGDEFAALASTYSASEKAQAAHGLLRRLHPEIGAAVHPIRRVYLG